MGLLNVLWLGTLAAALAIAPRPRTDQAAPVCLALGVGVWMPSDGWRIWPYSRGLTLSRQVAHDFDGMGHGRGWRDIVLEPASAPADSGGIPEWDRAWFWFAPTPDSLIVLRPAIFSAGVEFVGVWSLDTLRARATAFSDAEQPHLPHANAYGVPYKCGDTAALARALATVERFRALDVPNELLNAQEDSIENARAQTPRQPTRTRISRAAAAIVVHREGRFVHVLPCP